MARHSEAIDPAAGRHQPGGAARRGGRCLQPAEVPGVQGHRLPRRSSPTRAGCTRATWCRSPASGSVGSTASASAATTSPSTSTSRTPTLGDKTQASVQVLNLLGEKYLELTPKGSGKMDGGDTIPVSRTDGSYDIVATLERAHHHAPRTSTSPALPGPDHPGRHGQRRQPAHPVDLHRPLPHLPGHRQPRRGDPAAARPGRPRHQAARRAQGRPRHADEAGRPGLPGADRPPRGDPLAAGQRRDSWRSSCGAWPPTTRPRSATRSSSSTRP